MPEPTVSKRADLIRDQRAHLPFGTLRRPSAPPVRAGKVGTGDDLLVLAWSADDLARERAAGVRMLRALGLAAGMRIANALPGALETPGALLFGDVVEELGALDVPLGVVETPAAAQQAWELLDRVEPAALVLEPASALLAAAPARARPWWRGILWLRRGADPARPSALPAALGFEGWQRTWLAVPEAACVVAWSCPSGRFHLDEGVDAPVLGATLAVRARGATTPFVQSGVAARAATGSCPCGGAGPTLELP